MLPKKLQINNNEAFNGAFKIIDIIKNNGGTARLVGGAVRDTILQIPCKDIDIATDLLPEQIISIFEESGYKAIPTGLQFGTVTVIIEGSPYEITTLRRDLDTDGRHAKVSFTKNYEEDAARRDFTINALSYDPTEEKIDLFGNPTTDGNLCARAVLKSSRTSGYAAVLRSASPANSSSVASFRRGLIYDYFGGLDDLASNRVRFIGKPEDRIKEDYLRILRFFRFSAYYAKELDEEGLAACIIYAHNITKLSKERIKGEIDRLIITPKASDIFKVMIEKDIWRYVFGFSSFDTSLLDKAWKAASDLDNKLADSTLYALMMLDQKPEFILLLGLKFSRNQSKLIDDLSGGAKLVHDEQKILVYLREKWLSNKNWQQYFIFVLTLANKNLAEIVKSLYTKLSLMNEKPAFPVKSESLMELGVNGRELGRVLKKLKYMWISSDFSLTEDQLIQSIKNNQNG